MVKYLSGRQKRRPQDQLTEDRYKYLGLDQASKILGDMASVYFVSVAAIVAAFFGAQAIKK